MCATCAFMQYIDTLLDDRDGRVCMFCMRWLGACAVVCLVARIVLPNEEIRTL